MNQNEKIINHFLDFMIEKEILDAWLINIQTDADFFLSSGAPEGFITSAFNWCNSPEKHEFWLNLNSIWWRNMEVFNEY